MRTLCLYAILKNFPQKPGMFHELIYKAYRIQKKWNQRNAEVNEVLHLLFSVAAQNYKKIKIKLNIIRAHRIREWLRLEQTSEHHLIQPPAQAGSPEASFMLNLTYVTYGKGLILQTYMLVSLLKTFGSLQQASPKVI